MKSWTFVDKTSWGDGPWADEPDKAVWVDTDTGLDCMIRRGPVTGAWCGYVGVPPGHPLHGVGYMDIDLEAHGELTYSAGCNDDVDDDIRRNICHVPGTGRPADVWWLGFDCGHMFDLMPAMEARQRAIFEDATQPEEVRNVFRPAPFDRHQQYRDVRYVTAAVEDLARRLRQPRSGVFPS